MQSTRLKTAKPKQTTFLSLINHLKVFLHHIFRGGKKYRYVVDQKREIGWKKLKYAA